MAHPSGVGCVNGAEFRGGGTEFLQVPSGGGALVATLRKPTLRLTCNHCCSECRPEVVAKRLQEIGSVLYDALDGKAIQRQKSPGQVPELPLPWPRPVTAACIVSYIKSIRIPRI